MRLCLTISHASRLRLQSRRFPPWRMALRRFSSAFGSGASRLRCGSAILRIASCSCSGPLNAFARSLCATTPTVLPALSSTGMRRICRSRISASTLSTVSSSLQVKRVEDITSSTGISSGWRPSTTTRNRMSRSVRMPTRPLSSPTSTAPMSNSAIWVAASCTVALGATGSTPRAHHLSHSHSTAAPLRDCR